MRSLTTDLFPCSSVHSSFVHSETSAEPSLGIRNPDALAAVFWFEDEYRPSLCVSVAVLSQLLEESELLSFTF